MIPLPTDRWRALETAEAGRGPTRSWKHCTWVPHPPTGRLFCFSGDHTGTSYRNDVWSLSLAARCAGDRNAGWRQEWPECPPSGQIQPKRPDHCGWVWIPQSAAPWGDVFMLIPGLMVTRSAVMGVCAGETPDAYSSDPLFPWGEIMTFDPAGPIAAGRYRRWGPTLSRTNQSQWMTVYDEIEHQLIRFDYDGGWGGLAKHLALTAIYGQGRQTQSQPLKKLSGEQANLALDHLALDPRARCVYGVDSFDPSNMRLGRYWIEAKRYEDLGHLPGNPVKNWTPLVWHPPSRTLYVFAGSGFSTWREGEGFQPLVMDSTIPAMQARGCMAVYHPAEDCILLCGGESPDNPYLFLYRPQGDTPMPPPTIIRATPTYVQQPQGGNPVVKYVYDLLDASQGLVEHNEATLPVATVDFAIPPPGTGYTVRCQTLDAGGLDLAPPQTSPSFDVAGIQITVIGAVTVQVL